jgi:hypothetical protein
MNPRNAITFLRSPTGILLSFVVLLIFAIVFVKGFYDPNKGKPKTAAALTPAEKTNRTSQVLQTIQREIVPFKPPRTTSAAMLAQSTGMQPQQINDLSFTPISLYTEPASDRAGAQAIEQVLRAVRKTDFLRTHRDR